MNRTKLAFAYRALRKASLRDVLELTVVRSRSKLQDVLAVRKNHYFHLVFIMGPIGVNLHILEHTQTDHYGYYIVSSLLGKLFSSMN